MLKKFDAVPESLTINMDESLGRKPWSRKGIRGVSTHSKIYFHGAKSILNISTIFQAFGWDPEDLVLPETMPEHAVRTMLGNMVAVPTIGAAQLLALVAFHPQVKSLVRSR